MVRSREVTMEEIRDGYKPILSAYDVGKAVLLFVGEYEEDDARPASDDIAEGLRILNPRLTPYKALQLADEICIQMDQTHNVEAAWRVVEKALKED